MKSASTVDRTEFILYDLGSRCKPIAKLEYSLDSGQSFIEFADVKNLNYSTSNKNNQYNKFILVPPAKTMSGSFDNKQAKYSPGSGNEFDGILTRNLLVKPSFGYQMTDTEIVDGSYSPASYTTLYHTKVNGDFISNDVTGALSFTHLPNITEPWFFYDGQKVKNDIKKDLLKGL